MQSGDILGHEFMGEIVELGPAVKHLKIGDRVVA
jgi:threonine dehydrogenase-like Zn-dependent dehydrogenase